MKHFTIEELTHSDLDTRSGRNSELLRILQSLPHTELLWEQGGRWIHVAL